MPLAVLVEGLESNPIVLLESVRLGAKTCPDSSTLHWTRITRRML